MVAQNPILEDARYVMKHATHVKINEEAIDTLAREWADRDFALPDWSFFTNTNMSPEERFDHFMVADCLNFKYWNEKGEVYKTVWKGEEHYDADAMFTSLKRAEENGMPILDGKYLMNLTVEESMKIFNNVEENGKLAKGEVQMPMMPERVKILNAVGRKLVEDYDGKFHNVLKTTGKRVKIAEFSEFLAAEFPEAFKDVSTYKEKEVKIYKRANLAAAQAWENLRGTGYFEIVDPENSVVFADYLLPMVNRAKNCTAYSKELADEIDNGKIIPADSEKEIEIRTVGTILASDLLKERINFYRKEMGKTEITNLHLDPVQWREGFRVLQAGAKHHLTPTTDY